MTLHHLLLIIHLLCATVWVGGHLFLVIRILPKALKEKDVSGLKSFKKRYEPLGMPSLLILIITGIWMAYNYNVKLSIWFSFSNTIEKVISLKLILLLCTICLAIIADLFIFPKLNQKNIYQAGLFISTVTLLGVIMLILGSFIRFGGFS